MTETLPLSACMEDYLETILFLVREKHVARVRDIAARLKVAKASVSGALRALGKKGLINYQPYDVVTLTEAGAKAAEDVANRHAALRTFFHVVLGVEIGQADSAACRMEHSIPAPLLERFVRYVEFAAQCPTCGPRWFQGVGYRCVPMEKSCDCERCAARADAALAVRGKGARQ